MLRWVNSGLKGSIEMWELRAPRSWKTDVVVRAVQLHSPDAGAGDLEPRSEWAGTPRMAQTGAPTLIRASIR